MRIEDLFQKLESKTAQILDKIRAAVADGTDHVDILEKDIHILFKFTNLSAKRSEWYRDEIKNARRENDFMFQQLFESARESGGSGEPEQFWLEQLLYILETSHEDILADAAGNSSENAAARTYSSFVKNYALQIWKAAEGYEFFLNEALIDFEGDTQSCLGVEEKDGRFQLMWMTSDDIIHRVFPISPKIAITFCNEARCWVSPAANYMHRAKIPYPENTLLKDAPHRDIINIDVPKEKRGGKTWPATVAWRVNIGTLSREQHRIIASYSLSHAKSLVVVQNRARFERAKRELELFMRARMEHWKSIGARFEHPGDQESHQRNHAPPGEKDVIARLVEDRMSALDEVLQMVETDEVPPMNKRNAITFWLAIDTLESTMRAKESPSSGCDGNGTVHIRIMHPALKLAFEEAYPQKHPSHRDLNNVDFPKFIQECIGEEMFKELCGEIRKKISELIAADGFEVKFEAAAKKLEISQPYLDLPYQETEENFMNRRSFRVIYTTAEIFDVLGWMFDERQDILATFVRQIAVPTEALQPGITRIRARRK